MSSPALAKQSLISQTEGAQATGVSTEPAAAKFDFLDLRAQFATIRDEVMHAVTDVLQSQLFILGSEVRLFEQECAAYLGARHAVACASGSDALLLALMALGIGPGDEVITSPFTFVATAGSIARLGATPVFVDIDAETFNIDPSKIEAAVTDQTKAIMPVHLFGLPAGLESIFSLAKSKGLAVIEDAAQAIGARYRQAAVGTLGDFGCFSFFPSKNLGGAGDGGLITTQDAAFAEKLCALRVHGGKKKYHHEILGINSRLDALQAAILRVKMKHLAKWTDGRRQRAQRYRDLFAAASLGSRVSVPQAPSPEYAHVYNQFTVRCADRDALRNFLTMRGIPSEIYYPLCLHLQPAFAYLRYQTGELPTAETASREVLSLPVYPELTDAEQEAVVQGIAAFYRNRN